MKLFLTLGACTRVTVVILCMCLSVCYKASGYIPCLQIQSAAGASNACIIWSLLTPRSSPVLASFADSKLRILDLTLQTLSIARYIRSAYVRIVKSLCMRCRGK